MTQREYNQIVDAIAAYAHIMQAIGYHEATCKAVVMADRADAHVAWDKVESLLAIQVHGEEKSK